LLPKESCPIMGERVIKCCCMTGSTDAATDVVESATFRKTFNAIQSLQGQHLGPNIRGNQLDTYSKNSFRIWYAPKVGSLRIVYGVESQQTKSTKERVPYKIPHDLAGHVSPSDQDAP
jgi:hypothetical protein